MDVKKYTYIYKTFVIVLATSASIIIGFGGTLMEGIVNVILAWCMFILGMLFLVEIVENKDDKPMVKKIDALIEYIKTNFPDGCGHPNKEFDCIEDCPLYSSKIYSFENDICNVLSNTKRQKGD